MECWRKEEEGKTKEELARDHQGGSEIPGADVGGGGEADDRQRRMEEMRRPMCNHVREGLRSKGKVIVQYTMFS